MKTNCLFIPFFVLLMSNSVFGAKLDTLDVFSASMQKFVRNFVVLPTGYETDSASYPVVYLLHGYSGNYSGWLREAPQLRNLADAYQLILVFPDGGYDSWYLDSKVDTSVRYETYITKELIPVIDQKYRTIPSSFGRAITGLSMGGHGALYLTSRNQNLFCAAGSICGGVDLRPFRKNNWDLESVLGNPSKNWENWEEASVVNLVAQMDPISAPKLIIDCGIGDFFLDVNRSLHQNLLNLGIEHDYIERPGEHNEDYWCNAIDFQIVFFARHWGRM